MFAQRHDVDTAMDTELNELRQLSGIPLDGFVLKPTIISVPI